MSAIYFRCRDTKERAAKTPSERERPMMMPHDMSERADIRCRDAEMTPRYAAPTSESADETLYAAELIYATSATPSAPPSCRRRAELS